VLFLSGVEWLTIYWFRLIAKQPSSSPWCLIFFDQCFSSVQTIISSLPKDHQLSISSRSITMSYYGHGGATGGKGTPSSSTPTSSSSQQLQQQQQHHQHHPPNNNNNNSNSNSNNNLDQGKIFVGGLSWSTTEESLRFHFEQYGPVENVQVMRDRNTGEPRGFGFVIFQDSSTVDLVMADVPKGHEINHKLVDVKRAQARGVAPPSIHHQGAGSMGMASTTAATTTGGGGSGGRNNTSIGPDLGGNEATTSPTQPDGDSHSYSQQQEQQQHHLTPEQLNNKVFVGGIPPHIDNEGLKEIFEEFGPVVDAIIMVDQVTNRSRCFGFVTFENGSFGAQKAIAQQPLNIQGRNVEVKLATPKAEQRRAPPAAGPKHVGLRAGMISSSSSSSSGEYAGLAVAYGRSGWKAGYGTYAFGRAGWGVEGWEDVTMATSQVPVERAGFSFDMLAELPILAEKHNTNNMNNYYSRNHSNNNPSNNNNNNNVMTGPPPSKRFKNQ
jgi:RNA-binding protein Musashi